MPQPEMGFAPNPLLTSVGLNRMADLTDYASVGLMPVVPTATPTGTYNEWTLGDFVRREGKEIANYESVPLGGFTTTTRTFSVKNWGVGTPWTNRDLAEANSRGITNQAFKNAKARWVTTQGVMEMEFRVKTLFQTTANWTTTIAGVASAPSAVQFVAWDQAAATPVDDILLWKSKLRRLGGKVPNVIIIPDDIMLALRKNAQLIARATPRFYSGNTPMSVENSDIEALFGLRIMTPIAMYNSAAEGQTAVLADIWLRTAMWMGYLAPEWTEEEPTAAAAFTWTGATSNGLPSGTPNGVGPQMMGSVENDQGLFIREYPDLPKGAMIIEGMLWRAPVIICAELGMTFTAVIT